MALQPPPADFSRCRSIGEMSSAEYSAWCDAGKPEFAADRAAREARELQRRTERAAAPATTPAPACVTEAWQQYIRDQLQQFAEVVGEEIGHAEREARRYIDQQIATVRDELRELRAQLKVHGELSDLRREIEKLQSERKQHLRAVP